MIVGLSADDRTPFVEIRSQLDEMDRHLIQQLFPKQPERNDTGKAEALGGCHAKPISHHRLGMLAASDPASVAARVRSKSQPPQGKKEYLSESEANKIRDAYEPAERIALYMKFAEDRLKKFQYELNRKVQDRRRAEVLNNLLNAYAGCMDDAADQIAVGEERQADIQASLKLMKAKETNFSTFSKNFNRTAPSSTLTKTRWKTRSTEPRTRLRTLTMD